MSLKPIIFFALFILSGIYYYNLTEPESLVTTAKVIKVIDGDTLVLEDQTKVRLIGINTPESSEPLYEEAKQFLTQKVQNKTIILKQSGQDKYQRTLGYINQEIISQGLASLYYYEKDNYYEDMKKAEQEARESSLGIWKKSPNQLCIKILEFKTKDPEKLVLENICSHELEITYKDDATHIYQATIPPKSTYKNNFSHIWNNEGDTLYIYDEKGLILFKRY
jgi:micrococcal nuclease